MPRGPALVTTLGMALAGCGPTPRPIGQPPQAQPPPQPPEAYPADREPDADAERDDGRYAEPPPGDPPQVQVQPQPPQPPQIHRSPPPQVHRSPPPMVPPQPDDRDTKRQPPQKRPPQVYRPPQVDQPEGGGEFRIERPVLVGPFDRND